MLGLHWLGPRHGRVPDAQPARRWRAWRVADADTPTRRRVAPWHDGNLDWTGAVDRRPVPDRAAASAGCARTSSGRGVTHRAPLAHAVGRRARRRSSRAALGRRRGDRPARPRFAPVPAARGRPPHRRHELLHARAGGGDRARDRGLPRAGKRLERHRLQLPRRPLRDGLRGPRRRGRPERDRRARAGIQLRHGRRRADRQLHRGRRRRPRSRTRSSGCSPGASTSRTSTRSRRSSTPRAATRSSGPASS